MRKLTIALLGLTVSQIALAEPMFSVRCTETKHRGENKGYYALFEGQIPLGSIRVLSVVDTQHGQDYHLTLSAEGCQGSDMIAYRNVKVRDFVTADDVIVTQREVEFKYDTLIYGQSVGSQAKCDPRQVTVNLLKGKRKFNYNHETSTTVNIGETVELGVAYLPGGLGFKVFTQCAVTYIDDQHIDL